jgi:DNA adenine methylase
MTEKGNRLQARPFLKWAGGKRQLLEQLQAHLPPELDQGGVTRYVEPFVGSGALFFSLVQAYNIQDCLLADVNPELILVYKTIQQGVTELIESLEELENRYLELNQDRRKEFYYLVREKYNQQRERIRYREFTPDWVPRAAYMIFLNRTGYNGLFRLNSKGEYNVPFGRYKNPRILDAGNLGEVARLLQDVCIRYGDFEEIEDFVDAQTLVYFDPPYRPLSKTAHFTSYATGGFEDREQLRLATFYRRLHLKGCKLMLSNSDPHNVDTEDDFFERAYQGFRIERLQARRNINRDAAKRGFISELLILNFNGHAISDNTLP